MPRFCTQCGRPLKDGEVCHCQDAQSQQPASDSSNGGHSFETDQNPGSRTQGYQPQGSSASLNVDDLLGTIRKNIGFSGRASAEIKPGRIRLKKGEKVLKEYSVARLQSRFFGIPFQKAIGRFIITNRRVVFSAVGRSLGQPVYSEQEFLIKNLAGVSALKTTKARWVDFFMSLLIGYAGVLVGMLLVGATRMFWLTYLLPFISLLVFLFVNQRWGWKIFSTGIFSGASLICTSMAIGYFYDPPVSLGFLSFGSLIILPIYLYSVYRYTLRPMLSIQLKTQTGISGIDVQARTTGLLSKNNTGFSEVYPLPETDQFIEEINLILNEAENQ